MTLGEEIVELALEHLGEEYTLGVMVPMHDENWNGPWDCAEFVSWVVFQSTGILYGTKYDTNTLLADAYTGCWGRQAEADDARISIDTAAGIAGACILRKPSPETRGHIVISDGRGGTIEAHSRKRGVVQESLHHRNFDYGILVPEVNYTRHCQLKAVG